MNLNARLPEFLHRTKDEIEAEKERQNFTASYDEWAVRYSRALADEERVRNKTEANGHDLTLLAESLLEQGYFEEASQTHPDERYAQFLTRIAQSGKKPCSHPLYFNYVETREGQRFPVKVPNFRVWRTVFDKSFEKRIKILICNKCLSIWKENL